MKKTLGSLLLLACAAGCQRAPAATALAPNEARSLLTERNWIDKLPESAEEKLHVYRFVPSMGGGVYQDRTLYAGQFELFTFEATGEEIRFNLHHTGQKLSSRYRIEALPPGQTKGPLDLKLTVENDPRGPKVYYGARREKADLDEALRALAPR